MTQSLGGFTQIPVGIQPVQVCPPLGKGESVMLYNQDITNVVTVGTEPNVFQNASNAAPIQPLTSAVLPASKALYAVAPAKTAALVIVPEGGTLSPSPVQIAAQIAASGLATAANQATQIGNQGTQIGQAGDTNSYLGGTTSGALVSDTGISIAQDMLQANSAVTAEIASLLQSGASGQTLQPGIAPYIPNMKEAAQVQMVPAGSPYTLWTAPANSRLWFVSLDLAVAANAGYALSEAPYTQMYYDTVAHPLLNKQTAVNQPNQAYAVASTIGLGGYPVASGHSIFIGVNGGVNYANLLIEVSALIMYSTP
jgi:hypothetical protein